MAKEALLKAGEPLEYRAGTGRFFLTSATARHQWFIQANATLHVAYGEHAAALVSPYVNLENLEAVIAVTPELSQASNHNGNFRWETPTSLFLGTHSIILKHRPRREINFVFNAIDNALSRFEDLTVSDKLAEFFIERKFADLRRIKE